MIESWTGIPGGEYVRPLARDKNPGDALIDKIKARAEELGCEIEPLLFAG